MIKHTSTTQRGQELVEFALILPLLLLFLFGIIEFGIAVYRYNAIANIGREVARYGAIHPDSAKPVASPGRALIFDYIEAEVYPRWATALPTTTLTITPTLSGGAFISSTINVTVSYQHQFLTGPIHAVVGGDGQITMQTVSTMHLERPATP